ncbi:MAG: hypothetical protein RLZZ466_1115, partial [Bacteroidota bacterium]
MENLAARFRFIKENRNFDLCPPKRKHNTSLLIKLS